ncbi:MAG: hypothetical protein JW924_08500 [Fusobacteriaceae bacterium]|nr:hypothetical protein [Fusobacteriaceae bacterium]
MRCSICKKQVEVIFQGVCPNCTKEKYLKRFLKKFEESLKGSTLTRQS